MLPPLSFVLDRSFTPIQLAFYPDASDNASKKNRPGPKPKTLDVNQFAVAILEALTREPKVNVNVNVNGRLKKIVQEIVA
jgi:hypothetical protein